MTLEPKNWKEPLMKILPGYIEKAMNKACEPSTIYPWLGESVCEIMAKAAISVLEGMEDMENYLVKEGKLEEL